MASSTLKENKENIHQLIIDHLLKQNYITCKFIGSPYLQSFHIYIITYNCSDQIHIKINYGQLNYSKIYFKSCNCSWQLIKV